MVSIKNVRLTEAKALEAMSRNLSSLPWVLQVYTESSDPRMEAMVRALPPEGHMTPPTTSPTVGHFLSGEDTG